jgi:hypothetical protein
MTKRVSISVTMLGHISTPVLSNSFITTFLFFGTSLFYSTFVTTAAYVRLISFVGNTMYDSYIVFCSLLTYTDDVVVKALRY